MFFNRKFINFLFILILSLLFNFSFSSLYFEISKRERCFIEDVTYSSSLMLKWNIYPSNKQISNEEKFDAAINNINFLIKNSINKKILHYYSIKERKGKISFSIKEQQQLYICVFYQKKYKNPLSGIEMNLKLITNSSYLFKEKGEILKKEEVEKTSKFIKKARDEIKKINNQFSFEKKLEKEITFKIIRTLQKYKYLTYIQIFISIIIGILYLFYFIKYVKSLNLI